MDVKVDHHDKSTSYPILVWDFGQKTKVIGSRCYITLVCTTHIGTYF
jgi:hypothetical protein